MQLSIKDVRAISATVRTTKTWTRRASWFLLKLTDSRLKAHAKGELTLAPDVYLPLAKVVEQLWRVRRIAAATWKENVAMDREEREAEEAELLAEYHAEQEASA